MPRSALYRPEIQALRGIAVALVVACHLWPSAVPGGFVGVDVFFAISGFLITSHLLREIDRTGRISLPAFWARRARRLLPAAFTVLLACTVATLAIVPETSWPQFLAEIRASAAYVQNWQLASSAVDYFAASDGPSPVQHFWSLSAEEQFYLVWPVVLALLAFSARRPLQRRAFGAMMAAIAVGSLVYSIQRTAADPAAAYFVTPARGWEFAAGGLLALLGPDYDRRPAARATAAWLGLVAIALAAGLYSAATPFPGIAAALPIAGALAVIWAGAPACRWAPTPLLVLAPLRFLGDTSYSLYLWHWPLLVLAPFAIGHRVSSTTTLVVLVLSLLAAWLTKVLIEDPVRTRPLLTLRRARWTFASVGVGTALVMAVTASASVRLQHHVRQAERVSDQLLASKPTCFGAAARDPWRSCENPKLLTAVVPSPIEARKQSNAPCRMIERKGRLYVCGFGVTRDTATATVALVGDSHASHWRAALDVVARAQQWTGVSIAHTGCPLSKATKNLAEPARTQCVEWTRQALQWFADHPEVSTVFVSEISGGVGVVAPGKDQLAAQRAGYLAAWKALPATVKQIVVLRDTPKALGDTGSCVQRAIAHKRRAGLACAFPREAAFAPDSAAAAALRLRSRRVSVIDLSRYFCDRSRCYPVIGGALVFKDQTHMTETFSRSLGPFVLRAIKRGATRAA